MEGFIKLHRKLFEWEWYTDVNTFKLFIHLLLRANHKDNKWRGIIIKRGTLVTSLANLSTETGLSIKQIRTSLDKLESTGEVGKASSAANTTISITYYDKYQSEGTQRARQTASKGHAKGQSKGKEGATNKNDKNDKKEIVYSFDDFWNDYDYKVGKDKAFTSWGKLTEEEKLKIKDTVKAFRLYKPFESYNHPMPSVYLNGKRFNDEIETLKEDKVDVKLWVKNHLTYDQVLGEVAVHNDQHPEYNGLYYNRNTGDFQKDKAI